jgi:hypothetical protein
MLREVVFCRVADKRIDAIGIKCWVILPENIKSRHARFVCEPSKTLVATAPPRLDPALQYAITAVQFNPRAHLDELDGARRKVTRVHKQVLVFFEQREKHVPHPAPDLQQRALSLWRRGGSPSRHL